MIPVHGFFSFMLVLEQVLYFSIGRHLFQGVKPAIEEKNGKKARQLYHRTGRTLRTTRHPPFLFPRHSGSRGSP